MTIAVGETARGVGQGSQDEAIAAASRLQGQRREGIAGPDLEQDRPAVGGKARHGGRELHRLARLASPAFRRRRSGVVRPAAGDSGDVRQLGSG